MSDNESSDGYESEIDDDIADNNNEFFRNMIMDTIEEIKEESGHEMDISSNDDSDKQYIKNIYKSVVEKCRELYQNMMDASSDELWNSIVEKADSFKESNGHLGVNHDTAFEVGLKKYKCVLKQEIRSVLSEDTDEEVNEADTDLEETNKSGVSQAGSGMYRNFISKRW